MSQVLTTTSEGPVTTVRLNRPEVHNALNEELMKAIVTTFQALAQDESVQVVVLCGEGKSFCAGADLQHMKDSANFSAGDNLKDAQLLESMLNTLGHFPKPLVGQVHGAALGGGLGLTSCCDIVVAETGTTFGLSEVRLGLLPAVIMPYVLKKLGASQLSRYMLTGERFKAPVAQQLHLVHEVVDSPLVPKVQSIVAELLKGGPHAQRECKRVLKAICEQPDQAAHITTEAISQIRVQNEAQEGLKAFLEKRPAAWVSKS